MAMLKICAVVEGHGEIDAAPVLLRRVVREISPNTQVHIPEPIRLPKSGLKIADSKATEFADFERKIRLAAMKAGPAGFVLMLLDADDDCPKVLCETLAARARPVLRHDRFAVVAAKREFESWFLAAESLRGKFLLPDDLTAPADSEAIRGAKEWIRSRLPRGCSYRESRDQASFAESIDLMLARRSPSFRKLVREMERFVSLSQEP